jgi:phosphatidylserine/phosphatidylglycerophosphate/cardiolipin synthase-like enzyme
MARVAWLALPLVALSLAACAVSSDAATSEDELTACSSDVARAVDAAATKGRSTIDGPLTTSSNRVVAGPFVGGEAIAKGMVDLIASAKTEVMIEFFDVEVESWSAQQVKQAIRALPSSVRVYVLVNPDQNRRFFGRFPEKPESGVARMKAFLDDPKVTVGYWTGATGIHVLHLLHSKLVVVDGARAFVTDENLQRNADPVGRGGRGWYQLGMVVEGRVAQTLRQDAANAWSHATPAVKIPPAPAASPSPWCTPMTLLGRVEGDGEDSSADRGYAAFFRAARRNLRVITPNLNDDGALAALADATATARVDIVLSKGFNDANENLPTQGGTNAENVPRLAKLAKNKCNLHVRWYAETPGVAVDGNVPGANHAKVATVDGIALVLGSQNLDTQSWKQSRETSLFVDDAVTTKRFDAEFDRVWTRSVVAYEPSCR